MKNQTQIERKGKTQSRSDQQRAAEIRRKVAFIEAHGSKAALRKLDLVTNLFVRVIRGPAAARSAFNTFIADVKSRPFSKAFVELLKRCPTFAKDRKAFVMIAQAARGR